MPEWFSSLLGVVIGAGLVMVDQRSREARETARRRYRELVDAYLEWMLATNEQMSHWVSSAQWTPKYDLERSRQVLRLLEPGTEGAELRSAVWKTLPTEYEDSEAYEKMVFEMNTLGPWDSPPEFQQRFHAAMVQVVDYIRRQDPDHKK